MLLHMLTTFQSFYTKSLNLGPPLHEPILPTIHFSIPHIRHIRRISSPSTYFSFFPRKHNLLPSSINAISSSRIKPLRLLHLRCPPALTQPSQAYHTSPHILAVLLLHVLKALYLDHLNNLPKARQPELRYNRFRIQQSLDRYILLNLVQCRSLPELLHNINLADRRNLWSKIAFPDWMGIAHPKLVRMHRLD